MFSLNSSGDFKNTFKFFKQATSSNIKDILSTYGQQGVSALASATPIDSGEASSSWSYEVVVEKGAVSIHWTNSSMAGDTPVVILLQYGHGTGTGGYVQGRDFINPAIKPIMDSIADKVWKEVGNE